MNFIKFPVSATNLFPAANARNGSQLVTEWNMKSRETVATDPDVTYSIGPSYVHGEKDYEVTVQSDAGVAVSTYKLQIAPGRAVVNGHYVELLAPIVIDLMEENNKLAQQALPLLKGELVVGLKTFFSTDATVAGSILVEGDDGVEADYFLGIQVVILPKSEFITPSDSPTDQSRVTADLKLAKFAFTNNTISGIYNFPSKIESVSAKRVTNITGIVSDRYVTKTGLNSKKIYSFAGKGVDPATGQDTWEDVTDSTMVWDAIPETTSVAPTSTVETGPHWGDVFKAGDTLLPYPQQAGIVSVNNNSYLVVPHKQVTGMTDQDDQPQYYQPRLVEIPNADYTNGTSGFVNKPFIDQIKKIANEVGDYKTFLHGKQIFYMDSRATDAELPGINDAWSIGDYILVRSDYHYIGDVSDTSSAPSTLYAVLPGQVTEVRYIGDIPGDASNPNPGLPLPSDQIRGVELGFQEWYATSGQQPPETQYPEYYPAFYADGDDIKGVPKDGNTWYDYFRIRYYVDPAEHPDEDFPFVDYYYGVTASGPRTWSDAVILTGEVSLATEEIIGGFLNASENATDYGYVMLDDTGHLRLIDYDLLRSGTLAYQLLNNLKVTESEDLSEIQSFLTEYVNNRVAFPASQTHGIYSNVLHIYLTLPESDTESALEISGIDSRFNTAVCLHILGAANSNTIINIADCQKFMIDPTIEGTPVINIYRTCLYYDREIIQYIRTCNRTSGPATGFQDLALWYEKLSADDPALTVDSMTISEVDPQLIVSNIDYWQELGTASNDNSYQIALKSITFSGNGDIVGCQILAANGSTDNVEPGDKMVVGNIVLPQGTALTYPNACISKSLKVSGEFTSAYKSNTEDIWYVTDNSFTLKTNTYNAAENSDTVSGTVAFHSKTTLIPSLISESSIDAWNPNSYNVFSGGTVD